MNRWAMVSCKPTKTEEFARTFDGVWIAEQQVRNIEADTLETVCVMPGFAFVPQNDWLSLRRNVGRDLGVEAYIDRRTGRQKMIEQRHMNEMIAALRSVPKPNPMKVGDDVFCKIGPWAGLGGEIVKIISLRAVRVKFADEHVTIPRVFTRRS